MDVDLGSSPALWSAADGWTYLFTVRSVSLDKTEGHHHSSRPRETAAKSVGPRGSTLQMLWKWNDFVQEASRTVCGVLQTLSKCCHYDYFNVATHSSKYTTCHKESKVKIRFLKFCCFKVTSNKRLFKKFHYFLVWIYFTVWKVQKGKIKVSLTPLLQPSSPSPEDRQCCQ